MPEVTPAPYAAPRPAAGTPPSAAAPPQPAWQPQGERWSARQAPSPAPPATGWRPLDEARMVAIQLAASGATRAAVREHLHRELGVRESSGLLDEVFGAGSGDDARVPWTAAGR